MFSIELVLVSTEAVENGVGTVEDAGTPCVFFDSKELELDLGMDELGKSVW